MNHWWQFWQQMSKSDKADKVALEAEVIRLNKVIQDRTIPALIAATAAVESSNEILKEILDLKLKLREREDEGDDDDGSAGVREPRH